MSTSKLIELDDVREARQQGALVGALAKLIDSSPELREKLKSYEEDDFEVTHTLQVRLDVARERLLASRVACVFAFAFGAFVARELAFLFTV